MMFGKLGVKLPENFTATVGQENNVTFPVTPYLGNNMMSGGLNVVQTSTDHWASTAYFLYAPLASIRRKKTYRQND